MKPLGGLTENLYILGRDMEVFCHTAAMTSIAPWFRCSRLTP